MKKFVFLIPMLFFLGSMLLGSRILASGTVSPKLMILVMAGTLLILTLIRPKAKIKTKPAGEVEAKIRGEFAKDAFADDPQLNAKFQDAIHDMANAMPKAAYSKLTKLAPLCRNDQEKYAVSVATAQAQITIGKFAEAARSCTAALVLFPNSELAMNQGACYQRLGELDKARRAYTYAHDLDENNLDAISAVATTYVADRDYNLAMNTAMKVLEHNENHASSLATVAICHGLLGNEDMRETYTGRAESNGYSRKKINETIAALRK